MKKKVFVKLVPMGIGAAMLMGNIATVCAAGAFDAKFYASQNPDVVAIFGTDALSLYLHYITYGAAEGRMPSAAAAKVKAAAKAIRQKNGQEIQIGLYEKQKIR